MDASAVRFLHGYGEKLVLLAIHVNGCKDSVFLLFFFLETGKERFYTAVSEE